jgi:hypothetical protein
MEDDKVKRTSWKELLMYKVDRLLSGHPLGRFFLLGFVAVAVILVVAVLRQVVAEMDGDEVSELL